MIRVAIDVAPRPYDAVIARGLVGRAGEYIAGALLGAKRSRLFIVTVSPVRRRWGAKLMNSLTSTGFEAKFIEMPDGERQKRLSTIENLAEKLTQLGADRDSAMVAFGGGVVGDVTGLLASLYMRGVEVVQVPTTVLAQVDASIGGKTAVNLRTGKNLLGTFHQPRVVLIDPDVLTSLPEREFRAGLYESLKCGVIGRPELFEALAKVSARELRRDTRKLEWVIAESVKLKAEIVSADERENGLRRFLNFGHTVGHALEAETGYRHFLHGEAVAWGMLAATRIAESVDRLPRDTAQRINRAVLALGPLPALQGGNRSVMRRLRADKKTRNGVVHFVLPRDIGKVEIVSDVPEKAVLAALQELKRSVRT
jgi:3-dehydroquinate synthase